MQLILNDYSLSGQFQSVENDFSEYFIDTLCPILDTLKEKNIPLLKKSDFYSRKITRDEDSGRCAAADWRSDIYSMETLYCSDGICRTILGY